MAHSDGLRINSRIEKDIIPFLIRNYLWDIEKNEPNKTMIMLNWVQKKEDLIERKYFEGACTNYFYWHFTQKGKNAICKLINSLY